METANFESLSLYIHVPFCAQKCNYCDFYSVPYNESAGNGYVDALLLEWKLIKEKYSLENASIETLYFGGGTPSILSLGQWKTIIHTFIQPLRFVRNCEWSIECNPDSFSSETAVLWLDSGVTRLSIGIQTFDDHELRLLGRIHDARQARKLIENPVLLKFKSIGADLMYGIPGQTQGSLESSLNNILDKPVIRHLSAYELTIGEHTDFGSRRGLLPLPSEETIVAMTEMITQKTANRGFKRYEISNFSLPGHRCRHNEAYWRHKPYIGLGPAAHSYLPPRRFSNSNSLAEHIVKLHGRELPTGFSEILDTAALSREMMFLGLRTDQGVNESDFYLRTGRDFASSARLPALAGFVGKGMMEHSPPYWRLTNKGMLFADAIARELL
jgi:oxygen-independent coproporphyrinogen III oxidase